MLLAHLAVVILLTFTTLMRTPQIPTSLALILSWTKSPPSYIYYRPRLSGLQYALPWNHPHLVQPPIPVSPPSTPQLICPNSFNVTSRSSLYKNWCSTYEEPEYVRPQLQELLHHLVSSPVCPVDRFPKLCQAIRTRPHPPFITEDRQEALAAAICCMCLLLIVFVEFHQWSITDNEKVKSRHEKTEAGEVVLFQSFDENISPALSDVVFGKLRYDTLNIEAASLVLTPSMLNKSEPLEHDYDSCGVQKYSEIPSPPHPPFWHAESIETLTNYCDDYGDSNPISSSPKSKSSDPCINGRNLERIPLPINISIVADTPSPQPSPTSSSVLSLSSLAPSPPSSQITSLSTSPAPLPQDSLACEKELNEVFECNGPDLTIEDSPEKQHLDQSSKMLTVVLESSASEKIANIRSTDRRILEDTAVLSDSEPLIVVTKAAGAPEVLLSVMSEPENSKSTNALGASEALRGCIKSHVLIEGPSSDSKIDASWADEVDNAKFDPMYPPVTVVKPAPKNKPVPSPKPSKHRGPPAFHHCCQLESEDFTPESWDTYNWASCWMKSRFRPQDSDSSCKSTRLAVDNIEYMRCIGVRPGVRFSYQPLEKALACFNPSRVDCFNPRLDGTAQLTAFCYGIVDFETVEQATVAFAFLQGRRMAKEELHWRVAFLDPEDETCGGRRFVDKPVPVVQSRPRRIVAGIDARSGERRRPGSDIRALISAAQSQNKSGRTIRS